MRATDRPAYRALPSDGSRDPSWKSVIRLKPRCSSPPCATDEVIARHPSCRPAASSSDTARWSSPTLPVALRKYSHAQRIMMAASTGRAESEAANAAAWLPAAGASRVLAAAPAGPNTVTVGSSSPQHHAPSLLSGEAAAVAVCTNASWEPDSRAMLQPLDERPLDTVQGDSFPVARSRSPRNAMDAEPSADASTAPRPGDRPRIYTGMAPD
mmetsp:Transcript_2905/g.11828  ORF Transcript_2905/g.11828 Transcript_2905/m.11828 type:complete len:212 (+) Transcript_2905:1193-1828(+)